MKKQNAATILRIDIELERDKLIPGQQAAWAARQKALLAVREAVDISDEHCLPSQRVSLS